MTHRKSVVSLPPIAAVIPRREKRAGPPVPEAPGPWKRTNWHDRNTSLLVRGVYEKREELLAHHPRVQLPSGIPTMSTPVAALILAWERWPCANGNCPECGAHALGTWFGGMLSTGAVAGVCTQCALMVGRHIGGAGAALAGAQRSVAGTPYKFRFPGGWHWEFIGVPPALVTVLRRLGVEKLPKPSRRADKPWRRSFWTAEEGNEC
jgi:hypothetical protein